MGTRKTSNPSKEAWRAEWARRVAPAVGVPTAETVAQVWQLLGLKIRPERLRPALLSHFELTPDEVRELALTAAQALIVGLSYAVSKGRDPRKRGGDRDRQRKAGMITFTRLFDTLAEHWSPAYRSARETGARGIRDMKKETAPLVKAELLSAGVDLEKIWALVGSTVKGAWSTRKNGNQLYSVRQARDSGMKVRFKDRDLVAAFERLLDADPDYRSPHRTLRLMYASTETLPFSVRPPRQEVCAEIPYNVVTLGEKSEELITELERTVLMFNAKEFEADYLRWTKVKAKLDVWFKYHRSSRKWKAEDSWWRRLQRVRRKLRANLDVYGAVYDQVKDRGPVDQIPIRSDFFRSVNRRLSARSFWVEHVGGKIDKARRIPFSKVKVIWSSPRARWFQFPGETSWLNPTMRGRDVSSSGTQIISALMGDRHVEEAIAERSTKDQLATLLPRMKLGGDLTALAKKVWQPITYGGGLLTIIRKSPRLVRRPAEYTEAGKWTKRYKLAAKRARLALDAVLNDPTLPEYAMVQRFNAMCHRVVDALPRTKRLYDGVVLHDLYGGERVEWTKIARVDNDKTRVRYKSGSLRMSLPKYEPRDGRLPVDERRLKRAFAPWLIHSLDAYFLGLVVDRMAAIGCPVVVLHDSFTVPSTFRGRRGMEVLETVMDAAQVDWYRGIVGILKELAEYLPGDDDLKHALTAWHARDHWNDPPKIAAARAELVSIKDAERWRRDDVEHEPE